MQTLQILKRKAVLVLWAAFTAWGYFWITLLIYDRTPSLLMATVLNAFLTIFMLLFDITSDLIYHACYKYISGSRNFFLRMLNGFFGASSIKSAVYFFYIVVLIVTAIRAAQPDFPIWPGLFGDDHLDPYLLSVRYGMLLLLAADKFLEQITQDLHSHTKMEQKAKNKLKPKEVRTKNENTKQIH
ncbi:MAG: hypothetical protein FWD06_08550 [Oscillospiraceae bacterium]|nr:hypothetical protein [Oscillospiraceae bacterium]